MRSADEASVDGKPAVGALFKRFSAGMKASGYLAVRGQIVDATKPAINLPI